MAVPRVDAVIVCYGRSIVLGRAVAALLADPVVGRVFLVDNGRTEGQPESIQQGFGCRIALAGDGSNVGFGAGVNAGARCSNAEFLAIVNPDCVVGHGAIQHLVRTLDADEVATAVGGMLLNEDGSEQEGGRREVPSLLHAVARRLRLHRVPGVGGHLDFNHSSRPVPGNSVPVGALSGAFMVVRRARFAAIGGFDERFFLHFEDLDLCVRLRQNGKHLLFDPQAQAVHLKGESSADVPLFVTWHKHRSYVLFRWKHSSGIEWAFFPFDLAGAAVSLGMSYALAIVERWR